jgi:hypothetical protein
MMHMPNNDTLIRVWAAIRSIAEMLCRRETWPRFVPDKGYAEKAAEWRAKLEEEGTKARRHEGTKARRDSRMKRRRVKTSKRRNRDRPRQRLDA